MKDRPIIFSGPMVQAILDGSKTQTRRIVACVDPQRSGEYELRLSGGILELGIRDPFGRIPGDDRGLIWQAINKGFESFQGCPYPVGTRLWIKEAWTPHTCRDMEDDGSGESFERFYVRYEADNATQDVDVEDFTVWEVQQLDSRGPQIGQKQNPRFMPRWASRITLEVSEVRVQRLQELSEIDAVAEGIIPEEVEEWERDQDGEFTGGHYWTQDYIHPFAELWNSLNAKRGFGWSLNPWVWALTFARVP